MLGIFVSTTFLWEVIGLLLGGICGYFIAIRIFIPLFGLFSGGSSVSVGFDIGGIISAIFILGFAILGGAALGLTIATSLAQ